MIDAYASELSDILWRSLLVSGVAVLVSSLVGIPMGVWLGSTRFRGRSFLSVLIQTGMALPPVVVGLLVYLLLSRSGPLGGLGWLFTVQAMIVAQVVLTLPFVVGITMVSIAAVLLNSSSSFAASELAPGRHAGPSSVKPALGFPWRWRQHWEGASPRWGRCSWLAATSSGTPVC